MAVINKEKTEILYPDFILPHYSIIIHESGLKSSIKPASAKTTAFIGLILMVLGDCFAINYLFRADSYIIQIIIKVGKRKVFAGITGMR